MKTYIYSVVILACLSLFSCNDILDRNSDGKIDSESMWSTRNLASQGVNSMYQALRVPVWSGDLVGVSTNLGYYAWEAFGMTGQTNKGVNGVFSNANAGNVQFSATWKWCFTGINRANDAINGLPDTPMNASEKAQWIAEAKTLRAFFYMRLVELYGRGIGVPIYEEVVTSSTATKGQSSEAEVWDFIINSLTDAIETDSFANKVSGKESGKVSKGVAYALRGKAYLMRSMSLGENHYLKASEDLDKVGTMGYSLFNNYAGLFKEQNEGNSEILMVVQNLAIPTWIDSKNVESQYGSGIQKYCAPYQAGSKDSRGCWNDIQISPAAVDYFEVLENPTTVKDFNWNDFIPGYDQTSFQDRMVYFLRYTQKNGANIHTNITKEVNLKLNAISSSKRSEYLPSGNEERLVKAYANRDPRLAASIITPYSSFVGVNSDSKATGEYVYRWPALGSIYFDGANAESSLAPGMKSTLTSNNISVFVYMFRKFIAEGVELDYRNHSSIDEPILRYADVLLMRAEALVELNDLPGAKAMVQLVRDRVGMPTMDKFFVDQATARNYVRDERRREFVGEGVNFFDEMRWKTLKETKFEYASKSALQVTGASAPGPIYIWRDSWYTWPTPKVEVEMNSNLKRTPGWTY